MPVTCAGGTLFPAASERALPGYVGRPQRRARMRVDGDARHGRNGALEKRQQWGNDFGKKLDAQSRGFWFGLSMLICRDFGLVLARSFT